MTHRIEIPFWRPCALNRLLYARNWFTREKLKKADAKTVRLYADLQRVPLAVVKRRVGLEITLKGRQKEADIDAYPKTTLDALVACGLLLDDKANAAEWGGVQYQRGPALWGELVVDWGTIIFLEDMA